MTSNIFEIVQLSSFWQMTTFFFSHGEFVHLPFESPFGISIISTHSFPSSGLISAQFVYVMFESSIQLNALVFGLRFAPNQTSLTVRLFFKISNKNTSSFSLLIVTNDESSLLQMLLALSKVWSPASLYI